MTTTQQLAGITAQHNEIVKRVSNGSLDPAAVRRALQDIIEGKFIAPAWWCTPEQQLERARRLWPNAILPETPKEFTPRTKSEVLLLHVPDSFDSLWYKIVGPRGYAVSRWENLVPEINNLSLVTGRDEYAQPIWLGFDPDHGKGQHPDSFWGRADIAASEVLSALIQFPQWPLAWRCDAPVPTLAGYRITYLNHFSLVPLLSWGAEKCALKLSHNFGLSIEDGNWASPSIREC